MRYDHGSRQNQVRAASLLETLKAKLSDATDKPELVAIMQSPKWSTHWRLCNVVGVHAYETPQGWRADLAFRDLPAGVPTLIGYSVPCTTREEAMDGAVFKLSICAETQKAWLANFEDTMRWFAFDEINFPVDPDYLPVRAAELAREGYTRDHALGRLAYLRHVISGDEPLTEAAVGAADEETRERLSIVCEIAMSLGLTEFTLADGVWAEFMPTAPGPMQ
jgi:hypothetical protein